MESEPQSDADSLRELGATFCVGYVGYVMCDSIEALRIDINDRINSITKLLPYLSGLYYTDRQRRVAEAEIFRLTTELSTLNVKLVNTLAMAPEIGRPVTVTHT